MIWSSFSALFRFIFCIYMSLLVLIWHLPFAILLSFLCFDYLTPFSSRYFLRRFRGLQFSYHFCGWFSSVLVGGYLFYFTIHFQVVFPSFPFLITLHYVTFQEVQFAINDFTDFHGSDDIIDNEQRDHATYRGISSVMRCLVVAVIVQWMLAVFLTCSQTLPDSWERFKWQPLHHDGANIIR